MNSVKSRKKNKMVQKRKNSNSGKPHFFTTTILLSSYGTIEMILKKNKTEKHCVTIGAQQYP